jgi:hypothetical protein
MPIRACGRDRWVARDGRGREVPIRRGAVSRGQSTGGIAYRREGPNAKPRRGTLVLVGWTMIAANPTVWGLDVGMGA